MLGTLGFSVAAIVLIIFAYSTSRLAVGVKDFDIKKYWLAYVSMAAAMAAWGVGTLFDEDMLKTMVIVGDVFLFISTALLAATILPKKYLFAVLGLIAVGSVGALYYRAANNDAFMNDDVLVFNTPRLFGILLVVVLLLIWFRANLKFYEKVIREKVKSDELRASYFSANLIGYIAVSGFLFAKKTSTIIVSFSMLILAFVILTSLNYYSEKLSKPKGGQ